MIKRKINNSQNNQCPDDLDLINLHQEKDLKNLSKKNLEDIYSKVLRNLEEIKSKQKEIESRIEVEKEKNESALNENISLKNEFTEKKNYTKNLEFMIILILELTASTEKSSRLISVNNQSCENTTKISSNLGSLSELVFGNGNEPLNSVSRSLNDNNKAIVLKNLIENCNDAVIKSMVIQCLEKYNLKLEDIDMSISKKSKPCFKYNYSQAISTTDNSPAQIRENQKKFQTDNKYETSEDSKRQHKQSNDSQRKIKLENGYDINLNSAKFSSPESMLSTNDCIFGISNKIVPPIQQKTPTGKDYKKKRNQYQGSNALETCTGDLNLDQKEKDSMFEEVNRVTPFLISSPGMSPPRLKKLDSLTLQNDQNDNLLKTATTNTINPILFNYNNFTGGSYNNNNNFNNFINHGIRNICVNQTKYNPEAFFSFCDDNSNSNTSFLNKKHN
jgi:hypothetical protein